MPATVDGNEVLNEHGNILRPIPQRRRAQLNLAQPVIEILATLAALDGALEILVRGGDHTNLDTNSVRAAKRPHFPLLKKPQQHSLPRQRQVTDLIEEQRPPISRREQPRPPVQRPREGAALVPEELTGEQFRWQRRAIDNHERSVPPSARPLDRSRDQLLAGAALTGDQDGRIGRRDPLDKG